MLEIRARPQSTNLMRHLISGPEQESPTQHGKLGLHDLTRYRKNLGFLSHRHISGRMDFESQPPEFGCQNLISNTIQTEVLLY